MKRIKKIGIFQTAKVAALIYLVTMGILIVPFALFSSFLHFSTGFPFLGLSGGVSVLMLIMPVVYAVIAFVVTAIACAVYNWVASWTGGIEVEMEEVPFPPYDPYRQYPKE